MRKYINIISAAFIIGTAVACTSEAKNTESKEESCCSSEKAELLAEETSCCSKVEDNMQDTKVTAYYFHATRRCATCEAVEKVSKEFVEANYKGKVSFITINREEDQNKDLVEKYQISGQTLLIVSTNEVKNLTTDAFLNARKNPEKLESLLKSTIDSYL